MNELATLWEVSKNRKVVQCEILKDDRSNGTMLSVNNLKYKRGSAMVQIKSLDITAGIYALTGANGSGKSTLFRVLMSCGSNDRSIDLPTSVEIGNCTQCANEKTSCTIESNLEDNECSACAYSIFMSSSDIVQISQTFYWPLYTKPIDWIYQSHNSDFVKEKSNDMVTKVAEELQSLLFNRYGRNGTENFSHGHDAFHDLKKDLQEEKEDWFNDLSGGQKSKVELVRKVFLEKKCPAILLIDETLAPLDPTSKNLAMKKIKSFCKESVVIVIYHSDVTAETTESNSSSGTLDECISANGFFDHNLHVENGMMKIRPLCLVG